MRANYHLLTEDIVDRMENASRDERHSWLLISLHPDFPKRFYVEGLEPSYFFDFEDIIGQYRSPRIGDIDKVLERAEELDYEVVFLDDPEEVVAQLEELEEPPPFSLNSNLEGTINGALPYQINGYNFLKNPDLKGGFAHWSTGCGKSAFEFMMVKHHMEYLDDADLCIMVVKPNNKIDTQKKAKALADIESTVIDGTPEKRDGIYEEVFQRLSRQEKVVLITNYEKFKDDEVIFSELLNKRRVLIFWDEMPTKLRNRDTQLYKAVARCLYGSTRVSWKRKRPLWLKQYMLTATPLENSPVDIFNCVRLLDPTVFPAIKEWEKKFVSRKDSYTKDPADFRHLELMGMQIEFMTHTVDKSDPEIAKMFPKSQKEILYIDWTQKFRGLYDKLQKIAGALTEEGEEEVSLFALITILQMLCDAPEMVKLSAENHDAFLEFIEEFGEECGYSGPTGSASALMLADALPEDSLNNDGHPKLEELKYLLLEKHPDDKFVFFSTFSSYIFPSIEKALDEWGVTYVTYKGTPKQREAAKNKFREDPDVRVFVSSDAGSDSIDLPEGRITVHYNSPWKDSTETQRDNRINRVNSEHEETRSYVLVMEGSVEERKREIIAEKRGYSDAIFNGGGDVNPKSLSSEDMMYILFGES